MLGHSTPHSARNLSQFHRLVRWEDHIISGILKNLQAFVRARKQGTGRLIRHTGCVLSSGGKR